jgi:hypothetical protein
MREKKKGPWATECRSRAFDISFFGEPYYLAVRCIVVGSRARVESQQLGLLIVVITQGDDYGGCLGFSMACELVRVFPHDRGRFSIIVRTMSVFLAASATLGFLFITLSEKLVRNAGTINVCTIARKNQPSQLGTGPST